MENVQIPVDEDGIAVAGREGYTRRKINDFFSPPRNKSLAKFEFPLPCAYDFGREQLEFAPEHIIAGIP